MARTKTASNAILYYEAGQSYVPTVVMTDSGDHTKFTSADTTWSGYEGKEPVVRPNGMITGGVITPAASGTDNLVDVTAGTCYVSGALVSVSAATDLEITRATSTDTHIICSVVVTSGSYAVVAGTDHTAFSTTRDATGGPPLIPVDSVEVGQVRLTSYTDAAIDSDEIFMVPGTHTERADYPVWDENWADGEIDFAAANPLIHTGATARKVFVAYYTPIFSEVSSATDFVPAETTHSVTSTQIYGGTVGATSATLGQGSFTTRLQTGVTDGLIDNKNKTLWFKFYPDRYRNEYILTQGVLGIARTFPAGAAIMANCTISASSTSIDKES